MPEGNTASDLGITLPLRVNPDIGCQVLQVLKVPENGDDFPRQFRAGVHVEPAVGGVNIAGQGRAVGNFAGRNGFLPAGGPLHRMSEPFGWEKPVLAGDVPV